jgi:putative FmdB family regulatory protein
MPTYEYKREDGTTFEIKQSINDDALEKCPETGQKVKRVISGGGGVVYKGEGWYVTDYKDTDRKKKAKAEKESGSDNEKKESKGKDKKEKKADTSEKKSESQPT